MTRASAFCVSTKDTTSFERLKGAQTMAIASAQNSRNNYKSHVIETMQSNTARRTVSMPINSPYQRVVTWPEVAKLVAIENFVESKIKMPTDDEAYNKRSQLIGAGVLLSALVGLVAFLAGSPTILMVAAVIFAFAILIN